MAEVKQDNIYQKLAVAKVTLQSKNLTKTGWNPFSEYKYFQLTDFLPELNKICADLGLLCKCDFPNAESAKMTIINIDNPEETITILSPAGVSSLKGANEVQNIGATQTYLRRYLYFIAFDITDADAIDENFSKPDDEPKQKSKQKPKQKGNTFAQAWSKAQSLGINADDFHALCKTCTGKESSKTFTQDDIEKIEDELAVREAMG